MKRKFTLTGIRPNWRQRNEYGKHGHPGLNDMPFIQGLWLSKAPVNIRSLLRFSGQAPAHGIRNGDQYRMNDP